MEQMTNQIFLKPAWSVFLGVLPENNDHIHYSVEICISLTDMVKIGYLNFEMEFSSCVIGCNTYHRHLSNLPQISILLSPLSELGLYYAKKIESNDVLFFSDSLIENTKEIALDYLKGKLTHSSFIDKIQNQLNSKKEESRLSRNIIDDRILASIDFIRGNYENVISLTEVSSRYNLSESRFLHLFKKETGISFRKIQVWNKLARSFRLFQKNKTLTEIAYECGFTDSAHFTKKFKETFGISPKQIRTATLYNFID